MYFLVDEVVLVDFHVLVLLGCLNSLLDLVVDVHVGDIQVAHPLSHILFQVVQYLPMLVFQNVPQLFLRPSVVHLEHWEVNAFVQFVQKCFIPHHQV